jgi:two-component SAPR family response regulator
MRILALDDEVKGLSVLVDSIKKAEPESEVVSFRNVKDATEYVKANPVDVAFLDIHVGKDSGIEFGYVLKRLYPKVNIIFATDYTSFTGEAFLMHASGYLTKPITPTKVQEEMEHLRYPLEVNYEKNKIFIKTFGNFDIFVDGKPINFKRNLSKEVLAILVDREGKSVNRMELASVLFGDDEYTRKTQDYLSKIIKELLTSLKEAKCEDLIIKNKNFYSVDKTKFVCDAYEFLAGNMDAINLYQGVYMGQYVWGEEELYRFEDEL